MATQEELVFRTRVETDNSAKEADKLTESLKDVDKAAKKAGDKGSASLDKLNKTVKEGNFTMGEAATIIEEYATIALRAGKESPVGREAIQMAGQLTHVMTDLQTDIANASLEGENLKASLELAGTVTAGYGALKGVMALTGQETEALSETFVKLQAIQSVLAGIEQARAALEKESLLMTKAKVVWTKVATAAEYIYAAAIGTTTGAMKLLRIAMLAIPIIAIIAGIMALISALAWFFSSAEKAEEMNNKVNESFEKQNKLLEKNDRAFKRNADNKRKLMESELATSKELHEFDKQRILDEEKNRKKSVALLKEVIPQKREAYKQALEEENYELATTIREEIEGMRDKYTTLIEMNGQYATDIKILENKRRNELAKQREADKKEEERVQKDKLAEQRDYAERQRKHREQQAKEKLEEQQLLEDILAKNIKDSDDRQLTEMDLKHSRELEELKNKYGEEHEIVKQATIAQQTARLKLIEEFEERDQEIQDIKDAKEDEKIKAEAEKQRRNASAELEGKLIMMREDFEATQELKAELAALELEQELEKENLTEGEKFKIRQEYAQKIDTINQENADREEQRQQDLADATDVILTMSLSAATDLSDAFFSYKLDRAEEGSAEEIRLEKKKFEVNKKIQIAQAIMQGIQAVQAAYSSGSAIPIVGAVTGPAFAALAGITSALNVAKISGTSFDGGSRGGGAATGSATPSVSVPGIEGQTPEEVTTSTQGLTESGGPKSSNGIKVTLLQSEPEESISESQKVSVVSSVG